MGDKPLASLCVFFYNQEIFVEETVIGALSQTYENLEIILSDDCSNDETFDRIQEAIKDYNGPHKIVINRNDTNLGLVPHVNKVLYELCHGDYIFINGGDDISMPDRVSVGISYFSNNPQISAVTFSYIEINKYGEYIKEKRHVNDSILSLDDISYLSSSTFMTGGVALSLKRQVLSKFGPMSNDCQTEDSVLRFRALLLGLTMRSSHIGLKYRLHDNNISKHIYSLGTELIAQQYKRDLEKVKESLSPQLYFFILNKIDYYIKYRNLLSEESVSGFWRRIYIKYKRKKLALNRWKESKDYVE